MSYCNYMRVLRVLQQHKRLIQTTSTTKISQNYARIARSLGKNALPPILISSSPKSSKFLTLPFKPFPSSGPSRTVRGTSSPLSDELLWIFRTKGAQKINFDQFCQALKEVAPKRFPSKSKDEAQTSIFKLVENKTPGTTGVTVSNLSENTFGSL